MKCVYCIILCGMHLIMCISSCTIAYIAHDTKHKANRSSKLKKNGWKEQSLGSHDSGHTALMGIQATSQIYQMNNHWCTWDYQWWSIYHCNDETCFAWTLSLTRIQITITCFVDIFRFNHYRFYILLKAYVSNFGVQKAHHHQNLWFMYKTSY